jgi:hypothetical protein
LRQQCFVQAKCRRFLVCNSGELHFREEGQYGRFCLCPIFLYPLPFVPLTSLLFNLFVFFLYKYLVQLWSKFDIAEFLFPLSEYVFVERENVTTWHIYPQFGRTYFWIGWFAESTKKVIDFVSLLS